MPVRLPPAYRGPGAVMGVGSAFVIVGSLPVGITLALDIKNSATVIGVGFIGFGMMLILPGLCWCIAVSRRAVVRRGRWWLTGRDEEGHDADALTRDTLTSSQTPNFHSSRSHASKSAEDRALVEEVS